jgi:hypothetical protein
MCSVRSSVATVLLALIKFSFVRNPRAYVVRTTIENLLSFAATRDYY